MTLARYRAPHVNLPSTLASALTTLTLCALVLFAPFARGLELGDITLHSSLNEPLAASIQLVELTGIDAEDIRVELASRDEFERSDINYSPFLENLSFSMVARDPDTGDMGTVTLSSERPLAESHLDLLINLRWPDGQLRRAYTLLADPAELADGSPEAVTIAGDYQVGENETLWHVALRVRRDSSVTVQQVMVAIQRENENAFINGNINSLRSDVVLRVPALGREAIPTESVALAEVQRQNRSAGLPVNGRAGLGELRLLDGEALAEAPEGAGSELDEQLASLETLVMVSEEALDRSRLQNQALLARLGEVSSQIELLDNIFDIEAERVAERQELPNIETDEPQRLAETADSSLVQPSGNDRAADRTVGPVDSDGVVDGNDMVPAEPESIAPPSEPVEREGKTLIGWLESPLALLGGSILLVAFMLGLLLVARRRAAAEAVPAGPLVSDHLTVEGAETDAADKGVDTARVEEVDELTEQGVEASNRQAYTHSDAHQSTADHSVAQAQKDSQAKPVGQVPSLDALALPTSGKSPVAGAPVEPVEEVDFDLGGLTFDEDDFDAADDSAEYGADYDDEVPIDEDEPLSSRIDLAVAYEAMGDMVRARKMLRQVLEMGSDYDQEDARRLLKAWNSEGTAD